VERAVPNESMMPAPARRSRITLTTGGDAQLMRPLLHDHSGKFRGIPT
jgi:hypothetical protein